MRRLRWLSARRLRASVAAVALAAAVLAGCDAAPPADDGDRTRSDIRAGALRYAACMRERGYDIPDPTFDERGLPRFSGPETVEKVQDYRNDHQECRPELDAALRAAGIEGKPSAAPEQLIEFTRCVREHGVPIVDPDPQDGLVIDKATITSPAWPAAAEACERHLPPDYAGLAKIKNR